MDVIDEVENDHIEDLVPTVDIEEVNTSENSDPSEDFDHLMGVDASDDSMEMVDVNSNLVAVPEEEDRSPNGSSLGECQHPSQDSPVRSGEDLIPTGEDDGTLYYTLL